MPTMPFGKHRDEDIEDIETPYLLWVIDNVKRLAPWLDRAIRRELRSRDADGPRDGYEHEETRRTHPPPPLPDLRDIVSRWHRQLSKQFHPGSGGSTEKMQAVNVARDTMLEMLAGEGLLR